MLNYIWAGMILIGIIVAACTGHMDEVSGGILDSSKEAVSLCILMLGIVGMWTGVMKLAEQTGIVRQLTKLCMPILKVLFPRIADREVVMGYIAANMIANLLGLGWAATPTGLKAMQELKKIQEEDRMHLTPDTLKEEEDSASDEMCMFLIMNISSLQLIPITMIAYRTQYGSVHPAAILIPGIIATGVSTLVGTGYAYLRCRMNSKK